MRILRPEQASKPPPRARDDSFGSACAPERRPRVCSPVLCCAVLCPLRPQLEKFIDGKWQAVAPADRLKITQLDGQVLYLCCKLKASS